MNKFTDIYCASDESVGPEGPGRPNTRVDWP